MTACRCSFRSRIRLSRGLSLSRVRLRGFFGRVEHFGEFIASSLVGVVEAERRNRNEVRAHRPKIRALTRLGTPRLDAHPIICPAPRIEPVLDAQKSRIAQTLKLRALSFYPPGFTGWIGYGDPHAFGPTGIKQFPNEIGAMLHRRFPDRRLAALLAGF